VTGIHQNNFIVLVDTVLVNPVRVQHPQIPASPTHSLFSRAPQTSLVL
jgi:hypothetical protein